MRLRQVFMSCLGVFALATWLSAAGRAEEVYRLVDYAGPAESANSNGASSEIGELRDQLAALEAQLGRALRESSVRRLPACDDCDSQRIPIFRDAGYSPGVPYDAPAGGGCRIPILVPCGAANCDGGCGSFNECNGCFGNPCCRSQGLVGGVEVGYLKAHNSSGTGPTGIFAAADDDASIAEIDPSYDFAPRLWVGYGRCDGLGARLRYWEFDHSYDVAIPDANPFGTAFEGFHGWDTWVADIEVTDSTVLGCHWDVTWSAGFRYVDFFENVGLRDAGAAALLLSKQITGIGLTASLELRRRVNCNIGLFSSVRGSAIYGDEDTRLYANIGNLNDFGRFETERNDVKFLWEAQLGGEYILPICGGGYYFLRAGAEVQYWGGFGVDQDAFGIDDSDDELVPSLPGDAAVGFAGLFVSAGIQR